MEQFMKQKTSEETLSWEAGVTMVIIFKALSSEDGSEEAPSLSCGDMFRISLATHSGLWSKVQGPLSFLYTLSALVIQEVLMT